MMRTLTLCLSLALLFACGDDDGAFTPTPDAPSIPFPDAAPDSATPATTCTCIALGVDYLAGVGSIARLELPSLELVRDAVPGGASGDPVVRADAGRIFVVNRFGADNVTIVDGRLFELVAQFSTGPGTNPQDVAIHGDTLFVPVFGAAAVKGFRLRIPIERLVDVGTSSYDEDGNPNAASSLTVGDRIYVTLGILDDTDPFFTPKGPGQVLILDAQTREELGLVTLPSANPLGFLHRAHLGGESLLTATAPSFSAADGCLARVSIADPPSADCLVDNNVLGGYVTGLAPTPEGPIFVAVSPAFGEGRLHRITAPNTVDAEPLSSPEQVVTDAAYCGPTGQLVYNDQITGGLHVYDVAAGTHVNDEPLDIGLPSAFSNGLWCF
jgi:hypothetical protein